ncbi:DUF2897 family protein [Alteromonas oceanisediminis]|nr:DUF2897 family protein [Alteromonas oceanisediminis]MBT0587299.1 DUF2897 family protein [Alteromonas oceanisediminis]
MSTFWQIIIVLLVFGIIVGNIMLVKHSASWGMKKPDDSDNDTEH